jgi:PIN domain nuclease of toxin-antitoxin system
MRMSSDPGPPSSYVVDTHTLIWFLEDSPRLGTAAGAILDDTKSRIIIPVVVLAEIWFLSARGRTQIDVPTVLEYADAAPNCVVMDLDRRIVECMPTTSTSTMR